MGGCGLDVNPEALRQGLDLEACGARLGEEEGGHRVLVVSAKHGDGGGTQGRTTADARARGVENPSSADRLLRRRAPEDEAVSPARGDRLAAGELHDGVASLFHRPGRGVPFRDEVEPRRDVGRPGVETDGEPVLERGVEAAEGSQVDGQERRGLQAPGRDEAHSAREVRRLDPREVQARSLTRLGDGPLLAVDFDSPHAQLPPLGEEKEPILRSHAARVERPGDDRPEALHREGTVDPEARRPRGGIAEGGSFRRGRQGGLQVGEAEAGDGRDGDEQARPRGTSR